MSSDATAYKILEHVMELKRIKGLMYEHYQILRGAERPSNITEQAQWEYLQDTPGDLCDDLEVVMRGLRTRVVKELFNEPV